MKKSVAMVLVIVLLVGVMTGCSSKGTETGNTSDNLKEVVGKVNGVEITREMIQDELKALEMQAIYNFMDDYLIKEFYKDIEINDTELTLQMEILKGQVGEGQWESYLNYMGYNTEEDFKEVVKVDMKRNKMKETLKNGVTVTEEEVQKAFESTPDAYKVLSGDMIFLDTADEFNSAKKLLDQEGMTLETLAKAMGKDVYPNENVTFSFAGFTKSMEDMAVGDLVATREESGTLAIVKVTKVTKTFEELKGSIYDSLLDSKLSELVENKLTQYYNDASVEIFGTKIQ